jgi:hypothetical protein
MSMQALFTNPAFQAAAAPFVVALLLTLVLRRCWPVGVGLAVVGGFLTTVMLVTGLNFQPLTSTRKIILCSLALPVFFFLLYNVSGRVVAARLRLFIAPVLVMAAMLWVIWPVLIRKEGVEVWLLAGPLVLFVATIMFEAQLLSRQIFTVRAAGALLLAAGTGITAMIAASALYSQLAFAVVAALGAVILLALVSRSTTSTHLDLFVLHAALVPVALLASAATVYAQLPLLVLLCLALAPLFAWLFEQLPIKKPQHRWWALIVTCLWVSIPVLPGIWLAWKTAGPVSF